jgi:DNA-binding CsgD family transcriptional regulator
MPRRKAPLSGPLETRNQVRTPSSVLYGREDDVACIQGLIDRVREGGAALILSGEAGIGKSSLLELAQGFAGEHGMRVLSLCGVTSEAHLPFGALQQAIGPIMKGADALPARQRSALQAAFGLSDDATVPDIFIVGLATLTLLTASAANKPILLAADDVQWLDPPSRDVLAFISRRLSSDPIVLLMATRDGPDEALRCSSVPIHALRGLDTAAAERLLDAGAPDLPPELRRRFLDMAAGNPLALVELPRGELDSERGESPWLPLTDRLERAFISRVCGLPQDTRALLLVIAENDSKSLREALDAGGLLLGRTLGLEVLAPAVSALLIELAADEVRFRHPLVRSAVHQSADLVLRHEVHAALARVIADDPDRRTWHRMASTIGPDEGLADELDTAATRSQRRGALAAAILALENAARMSSTAASRSERLLRAAELAADLGQPATVERLLREAELDQPPTRMRARFAWVRDIGQPLTVNDFTRISALVGFAADARKDGANDLALDLLWRAAQRCWWAGADDVLRAAILAAASELGFPAMEPRLIAIAGYVAPLEHGHDVQERLAAHVKAGVADPMTARILGLAACTVGSFELGVGLLTAASTELREQGRLGDLARVLFARSFAETAMGNWMGALKSAAESARLGEETGNPVWVAAATIVEARIAGMRGDFSAAAALAAQAERLAHFPGTSFCLAMLQNARGVTALGAGEAAQAYQHLLRVHTAGDPAFNTGLQSFGLADYVEAAVSCCQEAAAASVIEQVVRRSAPMAVPWIRAIVAYGKALLASPDRAEALFQEALATAAHHCPFLRGRTLLAYGEWLRRERRILDARMQLRMARDIFDVLGALPWSERARRELRAAGEASRPRAQRVLDTLTPQELQIAELAASGLSNKDIGARLYLSHRTIGYHLYQVYPKLGVTSRSGLRRVLSQPA